MNSKLLKLSFIIFISQSINSNGNNDLTTYYSREVLKEKLNSKKFEEIMNTLCIYKKQNPFDQNIDSCMASIKQGVFPFEDNDAYIKKIGSGSYGDIYYLFNKNTNEEVAIKKVEINANDSYLLASQLEDLNLGLKAEVFKLNGNEFGIVRYQYCCIEYKASLIGNTYSIYLQMPFFEDGDLRNFFKKEDLLGYRLNINWKYNIMLGIVDGIALLHSANYMHRDLKPDNILIADKDSPKLADYGFVCSTITANTDVGTPIYSAPELTSGRYTNKVDIYALGLILFEILNSGFQYTTDYISIVKDWCLIHNKKKLNLSFNFPDYSIEHYEREVYCLYFEPIVKAMLDDNPNQRPNADDVFKYIQDSSEVVLQYYKELNQFLVLNKNNLKQMRVFAAQHSYKQKLLYYLSVVVETPIYNKQANIRNYAYYNTIQMNLI